MWTGRTQGLGFLDVIGLGDVFLALPESAFLMKAALHHGLSEPRKEFNATAQTYAALLNQNPKP